VGHLAAAAAASDPQDRPQWTDPQHSSGSSSSGSGRPFKTRTTAAARQIE
jgi:hypothetical protein